MRLALTTNTLTKLVLAFSSGPRAYWLRVGFGLLFVLIATWSVAVLVVLSG